MTSNQTKIITYGFTGTPNPKLRKCCKCELDFNHAENILTKRNGNSRRRYHISCAELLNIL